MHAESSLRFPVGSDTVRSKLANLIANGLVVVVTQ